MPAPHTTTVGELARRHGLTVLPPAAPAPDQDMALTGVCHDSRRVAPGDLYAALPGSRAHGAAFAAQAVGAGAVALLTDTEGARLARAAAEEPSPVPVLVAEDARAALGPISADVLGHPSRALSLVGVTGTNGKTTVSFLLEELLRGLGERTGLIGTVRSRIVDEELPSRFTTPEAPDLQRLLARMRDAGCTAAATEVSSHALAQHRVDGTRFALTVFTNLSQDHLDFHGTMAAYFAAKLELLQPRFTDRALVGVDDPWGRRAARHARAAGLDVLTVGFAHDSATADTADTAAVPTSADAPEEPWRPPDVAVSVLGTGTDGRQRVRLAGRLGSVSAVELDLPIPGDFNALNAAFAVTAVLLLRDPAFVPAAGSPDGAQAGRDLPAVAGREPLAPLLARLVAASPGVPGRMERVVAEAPGAPLVVVDYAHSPDAIANAVRVLRAATPGRLAVVLGAGGDRDRGKRPGMGAAAAAADLVVVTDDNPRSEDPAAIRAAVLAGLPGAGAASGARPAVLEVAERRAAVRAALAACSGPADTVLLAGKGHESGQSGREGTVPFDDRAVARELLAEWSLQGVS